MAPEIELTPYATIVLHAIRYPSKPVFGLLLGTGNGGSARVTSAVPLSHESVPLAPPLEIALSLISAAGHKIVGLYFSNQKYNDRTDNPQAVRLAERIHAQQSKADTGFLLVQIVNLQLSLDCSSPCTSAKILENGAWKGSKLELRDSATLGVLSAAVQRKLYREVVDFECHLDHPALDFYNGHLKAAFDELRA